MVYIFTPVGEQAVKMFAGTLLHVQFRISGAGKVDILIH